MNILEASQESLSRRFAAKHLDRFDGVGYHTSPGGQPVLEGALAWIECAPHATFEAGDHTIIVGARPQRRHHRGHAAGLLPRRIRRPDPRVNAPATAPFGIELLDDPDADPAVVARSLGNIARANWWFGGARGRPVGH